MVRFRLARRLFEGSFWRCYVPERSFEGQLEVVQQRARGRADGKLDAVPSRPLFLEKWSGWLLKRSRELSKYRIDHSLLPNEGSSRHSQVPRGDASRPRRPVELVPLRRWLLSFASTA